MLERVLRAVGLRGVHTAYVAAIGAHADVRVLGEHVCVGVMPDDVLLLPHERRGACEVQSEACHVAQQVVPARTRKLGAEP